jgi:hypothetical protein
MNDISKEDKDKADERGWRIETFDKEVDRGILHTPDYILRISQMRIEQTNYSRRLEEYFKTLPPYDPDNHIADCGCVVKNGERIYWCGDHY